jgi:hypothetical protein
MTAKSKADLNTEITTDFADNTSGAITAALARTVAGDLADSAYNVLTDGGPPSGFRNLIFNGNFRINQRAYVSAAALASGAYGHDRFKAGSSGGDYSFTQLAGDTQITIAASKTLIQVIEAANVVGGSYVLSWTGTAQARYAVNSATPAGSYAASPILITGQTAGTTMSVEFGNGASTGTLGDVQLELGSIPTVNEFRPIGVELALCQRYFETNSFQAAPGTAGIYQSLEQKVLPSNTVANQQCYGSVRFIVPKRSVPTIIVYGYSGTAGTVSNNGGTDLAANSGVDNGYVGKLGFLPYNNSGGVLTVNLNIVMFNWSANAEL